MDENYQMVDRHTLVTGTMPSMYHWLAGLVIQQYGPEFLKVPEHVQTIENVISMICETWTKIEGEEEDFDPETVDVFMGFFDEESFQNGDSIQDIVATRELDSPTLMVHAAYNDSLDAYVGRFEKVIDYMNELPGVRENPYDFMFLQERLAVLRKAKEETK